MGVNKSGRAWQVLADQYRESAHEIGLELARTKRERTEEKLLWNWLRNANAGVRFESNGTVSAWANGIRRRRNTFDEAVRALMSAVCNA